MFHEVITLGCVTGHDLYCRLFFWQVWQNNRDIDPVAKEEIQLHFDRSVQWLDHNFSQLQNNQNPILWWFIKQAAQQSSDPVLGRIYHQYKAEQLDKQAANLSTPLFNELYRPRIPDISMLSQLDDYQVFSFYSYSCDEELEKEPLIQQQLEPRFCSLHYLHPRCITHQLMGLRFMQRYQCGHENKVSETISALQEKVISELTWDFRVTDSYIQRILMLHDTGASARIKPLWIKNILTAQNGDGSWDDLYPLITLPGGKVIALTSKAVKIQQPRASFHATAQALWLLSLLLTD